MKHLHSFWRRAIAVSSAGVVLGATAACGSPQDSGAQKPDKIVIGLASAETGFMSTYDGAVRAGARLAARDINAAGGIDGRKIEFVTADTKSDSAQAQLAAKNLLEKGAQVIIPSCDYNMGGPAARAANERDVLAVGCAGSTLFGAQGIGPLTFNVLWGANTEGAVMAQWAYNSKKWRSAYMLTATNFEYSKSLCANFEKSWKALGGTTIVGKDTYTYEDKSLASQLSRMRAAKSKSDVVVVCATGAGATAIRQMRAGGIDLPILGAAGFDGTYWLDAVPDLSDFYFPGAGSAVGDDPSPERRKFFKEIGKSDGSSQGLNTYQLAGYQAVQTYARGAEKAGSFDAKAVGRAIGSFKDEDLLLGRTTYTENCHANIGMPLLMMTIDKGKPRYLGKTVRATDIPKAPC